MIEPLRPAVVAEAVGSPSEADTAATLSTASAGRIRDRPRHPAGSGPPRVLAAWPAPVVLLRFESSTMCGLLHSRCAPRPAIGQNVSDIEVHPCPRPPGRAPHRTAPHRTAPHRAA